MDRFLGARYWALILVMLLTGLMLIVGLGPILYAVHRVMGGEVDTSLASALVELSSSLPTWGAISVGGLFVLLSLSLLTGSVLEAISVIAWPWIRRNNYFKGHKYIGRLIGGLERVYKNADIREQLDETEGEYPTPGQRGYASVMAHIAGDRELSSYLEWERFLHLFYERLAYSFAILGFGGCAFIIVVLIAGGHVDWSAFVIMMLGFVLFFVLLASAQPARVTHRQILIEAARDSGWEGGSV